MHEDEIKGALMTCIAAKGCRHQDVLVVTKCMEEHRLAWERRNYLEEEHGASDYCIQNRVSETCNADAATFNVTSKPTAS